MLSKLHLTNFGIHKDLGVSFTPGINTILGNNRRGKTHILESICYALFGKTQNSKIEKIINFDADEAKVELTIGEDTFSRTRTKTQSTLKGITKLELDNKVNLDYSEFLSIFYISSHEQKSLFDATYLRNLLIGLFNLDKYASRFEELNMEYRVLQNAEQTIPVVNTELIQKRLDRVKSVLSGVQEKKAVQYNLDVKILDALRKIDSKTGEIRSHRYTINQQIAKVTQDKCNSCGQNISPAYKATILAEMSAKTAKLDDFSKLVSKKEAEIRGQRETVTAELTKLNDKIYKGQTIIGKLTERLNVPVYKGNKERLKELEQILSILNPKSFPAYLLQIYVPLVTETANNLLQNIFSDMSVCIRTEKPESNRPDFKPMIKRGDNVQEMSDLSGSERAVVNLCFRLGVMVIFKQISKTNIDTLMIDEGFEKVDTENCFHVIDLLKNFLTLNYIKQVLLVTHKMELRDLSDINYIHLD